MTQIADNETTATALPKTAPPAAENGSKLKASDPQPPEMVAAKELARRYRLPFVDLLPADRESPIDYALFAEVPVDLMVRHQFVPLKRDG